MPKPLPSDKDGGMKDALDGEYRGSHAGSVLQPSSPTIFVEEQIGLSVAKKNGFLKLERNDRLNRHSITRKILRGRAEHIIYLLLLT